MRVVCFEASPTLRICFTNNNTKRSGRAQRNGRNNNNRTSFNRRRAPVSTGMVGGRTEARITNLARGSIRVQHREFIKNVGTTESFSNLGAFPLQPGDSSTFPWLSQLAQNYERWHPNRIDFKYEPFTSTFTEGTCAMMIDYDPNDSGPINKAEMLNSSGAMRSPVWSNLTVRSNDSELAADTHLFVRVPTRDVYTGNLRLTDSGTCFVSTTEVTGEERDTGEIWVDYDITFHVPSLNRSEPLSTLVSGAGTNDRLLGEISTDTAITGSSTSFKNLVSTDGSSILEFDQDFTGTVVVNCTTDGSNFPPDITADTSDIGTASPALLGFLETISSNVTSQLLMGVVAKAGDALRIITNSPESSWNLGPVVMRLLPYAKSLMGLLLAATTIEEKVVLALKGNILGGKIVPHASMRLLARQIAHTYNGKGFGPLPDKWNESGYYVSTGVVSDLKNLSLRLRSKAQLSNSTTQDFQGEY